MNDKELQACLAGVFRVTFDSFPNKDELYAQMETQGHDSLEQMAVVRAEFMVPRLTEDERAALLDRLSDVIELQDKADRCQEFDWDRKEQLQRKAAEAARKNAETVLNLFQTCWLDRAKRCPACRKRYGYRTPFCPKCSSAANKKIRDSIIGDYGEGSTSTT